MCGWTSSNHELRSEIINHLHCDIISINETHLLNTDEINLNEFGYRWIRAQTVNRLTSKPLKVQVELDF